MTGRETGATRDGAGGARLLRFLVVGGLLISGATLAFWAGFAPAPLQEERSHAVIPYPDDEDLYELTNVKNPGYVGIETCAECHAARATTFKTGRHYLACRPAPIGVAAPAFAGGRIAHETTARGLRFETARVGTDFLITRVRDDRRDEHTIGLVYGSAGKQDEMYFAWDGDRLSHLPMAWLHPHNCWGQASHTTGALPTHASCLECHNTWVGHVPGTINQYRKTDMFLGVTCERCHGPGRAHTDHHRANPNAAAHAIIHPGTLSRQRLMDVCAQCHANAKRLGPPFSYRPGEPLETHFYNARPTHQEDDTTNQVRYLSDSKCYQKSELTCITCHDPHRPHSAAAGCATCHKPAACTAQPRLPDAVRADCVGCHMPARVWTHAHLYTTNTDKYLPLAPRADHHIGVYPEATYAVVLEWLRSRTDPTGRAEAELLAAKVVQHWTNEAGARLRAGRFKAAMGAYREAVRIAPNPALRQQLVAAITRQTEIDDLHDALHTVGRAEDAVPVLEKMLAIKPNSAFAHGELGTILSRTGNQNRATGHLEAVVTHDPADSYGLLGLAEMAFFEGRLNDAAALCARGAKVNPAAPQSRHLWGLVLSKQGRWSDAEKQFRTVLAGDLAHVASNDRLSEALRQQGNATDAVKYARRAAHFSQNQDAEVLLTLANAYSAANRTADARKVLEQALPIATRTDPGLAHTIRDRLHALR